MTFIDTGLDPRLLRALAKKAFTQATPVQARCIPAALEGKDIVARARTGSGKTLAYLLPALHKILTAEDPKAKWRVLVLVPTRELCEQVRDAKWRQACGEISLGIRFQGYRRVWRVYRALADGGGTLGSSRS
jgi:ATP-dependent RNA helicase DDX56/DBP9